VVAGVTPKEHVAEYAEGIGVLERTVVIRRSYRFDDVHISIWDVLDYTRYESVTGTIVLAKKIKFGGEAISLSRASLRLLQRDGYK